MGVLIVSEILKSYCNFPGAVALKLAQDEHRDNEQDLRKDKRSLRVSGIRVFFINLIDLLFFILINISESYKQITV